MVHASGGIPLWAQGNEPWLCSIGKGHHERPARCYLNFGQRFSVFQFDFGVAQQVNGLIGGYGQQHLVKATEYRLGAFGFFAVQLPEFGMQGVAFNFDHLGLKVEGVVLHQGLSPSFDQSVHAWRGHPMFVLRVASRFNQTTHGVKHTHCIGAPGFAYVGRGGQGLRKAIIAHREILGAMIEIAKAGGACRHAATGASAFFKDGDAVACLHKGASASYARHARPNDGEILNRLCLSFCLSVCFGHGATLHAMMGLEQCLFGSVLTQLRQPPTQGVA